MLLDKAQRDQGRSLIFLDLAPLLGLDSRVQAGLLVGLLV